VIRASKGHTHADPPPPLRLQIDTAAAFVDPDEHVRAKALLSVRQMMDQLAVDVLGTTPHAEAALAQMTVDRAHRETSHTYRKNQFQRPLLLLTQQRWDAVLCWLVETHPHSMLCEAAGTHGSLFGARVSITLHPVKRLDAAPATLETRRLVSNTDDLYAPQDAHDMVRAAVCDARQELQAEATTRGLTVTEWDTQVDTADRWRFQRNLVSLTVRAHAVPMRDDQVFLG
jgi:hypothetical protein